MDFGDLPTSRREYLRTCTGVGLAAGVAGCNSTGSETPSQTETVVFTDSTDSPDESSTRTETTAPTPQKRVFDGGGITAFIRAVHTASQAGVPLEVAEGTYRFGVSPNVESGTKQPHAGFDRIDGLTIEGNGSTIVFTNPEYGGFRFETGSDITIRNLTFDYDPVPFTQGEITAFSKADGTVVLRLDDGFSSLEHQMFENAATVYGLPHTPDGGFVEEKRSNLSSDKHFTDVVSLGEQEFRLSIDRERSDFTGVAVGNRLTIVARDNQATLQFYKTNNPTLENVTVRTASGAAFITGVCETPSFDGCTVAPPPDSDRQLASVADGIRVTNCIDGSLIENCRHDQLGDDSIAVDNHMATVTEVASSRTIAVDGVHPFVVKAGDVLEAVSPSGIVRSELPPIESYEERFQPVGERGKPETITFEDSVDEILEVGDYVGSTVASSAGYRIRNNELRNHRANLIRANTKNGVIEDNVLEGVDGNAIELHTGTRGAWPPTCWVSDVTVRGNEIRGAGMKYVASQEAAAIYVHHETPPNVPTAGRPNQDVEIVDNVIEECASVGIEAEATEGLRIERNSMSALNQMDYGGKGYGVDVSNSNDVTVTGNNVTGSAALLSGFGKARSVDKFAASANTVTIDGEQQSGEVRQSVPVMFEFNRTVVPDGGNRQLTFLCFSLALLGEDGSVIRSVSLGEDESGVSFGEGVDGPESADGKTWRWFGPPEKSSVLYFYRDDLEQAVTLRVDGYAIEGGISATVSVHGTVTDTIEWRSSHRGTFDISLEQ